MSDIALNSLRVLLLAGILLTFWRYRQRERMVERKTAWRMILGGVGLMLFGSVLDVTENIPSLASFPALGDTGLRPWLENLVGYIGGCLLLFFGFRRWLSLAGTEQHRYRRLMQAITRAQRAFIGTSDSRHAFDGLLRDILDMTGSEYGFIGEVRRHADGQPYLKTHAITNIAWNDATRRFYEEHAPQGMEFTNLKSLFGAVLVSGEPVIANAPADDPRRGGLPPGHPPLHAFLGLPIQTGENMVGMVGIANRADGYNEQLIEFLRPLSSTLAQLIEARQAALARQAIEASHLRLSLVASRTNNGVIITDGEGLIEWVNAGFERLTGYLLSEVKGHNPGQVLHGPGTDRETVARMGASLRRHESFDAEVLNYTKGGQAYWIGLSVDPLRDETGQLLGFIGIETDISARKAAETALAASAQHIQAVLDHVLDGIITIDGRGIVASYNASAERIFGYTAGEVVGRNVDMLMPAPHRGRHDDYLRHYQSTGEARVIGIGREVEGLRKDGEIFPMDLAVTEIQRDGQPLYIGMVRDITERKRLERLKSEFLSTVSHELRTPLTAIRGALGLIVGGALGVLPAQAEHMIHIAHKNSEHLTRLINDLLDMEKMAAGGMRFDMRPQALMPLLSQAIEANRAYGEERRVSLVLTAQVEDMLIRVDATRFLQIMANLLSNAIKFSPNGGRIEIAAARRDDQARITVTDHGSGIPLSFRDHVFEKFSQADASDSRPQGGSGLGLAITRELVRRMDGNIDFESREGGGTTFLVDLPEWRVDR